MTKEINESNDSQIKCGKTDAYIQEFVNVDPKVFAEKKPNLDYSGISNREGANFHLNVKSFLLKKQDFLTNKYPFDFNLSPTDEVYIITDEYGKIIQSVPAKPEKENAPKKANIKTPDKDLYDLPF